MIRFPRAKQSPVVLDAELYNRLVDAVERSANLAITPPLTMEQSSAGTILGFTGEVENTAIRLHLTGNRTCGGVYSCYKTRTATAAFDSTQASYDDADIGTDDTSQECTFVNLNEQGTTDHSLTESPETLEYVWGFPAGFDNAGRPKYEAHALDYTDCGDTISDGGAP